MLKSRRMAYDGRGNAVISGPDAALAAVDGLGGFERGLYVEAWVPYVKELAIMVARSSAGEVRSFPVVETVHQDSILVLTEAPAGISIEVAKKAKILAEEAVASLKGTGIFGCV
jgi:phosphoribosylaminoimidazole carboxylase